MFVPYADPKDPRKKASQKRHYDGNRQMYLDRNSRRREEFLRVMREAKAVPCADCGGRYPYYVMDLDHRPDEIKRFNVSSSHLIGSMKALLAEIAKCDVVCANCHRERTYQRTVAAQ